MWIALSEEKGWSWCSIDGYRSFSMFLRKEGVRLNELPVCVEEQGEKAGFVKKYSKEMNEIFKVYTVRLDNINLAKIRSFKYGE